MDGVPLVIVDIHDIQNIKIDSFVNTFNENQWDFVLNKKGDAGFANVPKTLRVYPLDFKSKLAIDFKVD